MEKKNEVLKKSMEEKENMKKTVVEQAENFVWLNNAELQINPRIQRKLNPARVQRILENFSPLIANPIKVSFRDGKYYMFDGMHTRTVLCLINETDDFPILCRVYTGLTEQDEARLFASQFGFSEAIPMGYRLRALEVAEDQGVLSFIKATRDSGFKMTLGSHNTENGHIAAVCEAYKSFNSLGADSYTRMLKMLHKTWAGESWSVTRYMIAGMTRFMKMYEIRINDFVKAFREVTYQEIKDEAGRFRGMSKEGAFAAALAELYEFHTQVTLKEA